MTEKDFSQQINADELGHYLHKVKALVEVAIGSSEFVTHPQSIQYDYLCVLGDCIEATIRIHENKP